MVHCVVVVVWRQYAHPFISYIAFCVWALWRHVAMILEHYLLWTTSWKRLVHTKRQGYVNIMTFISDLLISILAHE